MRLPRHGTRAEAAEATRHLTHVVWPNRPVAAQLELAAPADPIVGRWSG